ncbi:MAG TPA: toast rack family protein [Dongiaceae bacterium]|nr:toast rack family protein [Dongiaceae bacterium]
MSRDDRLRSSSVVFPLLLIGFGVLVLIWREVPHFHPGPILWKYWPLLLVLLGAGMFFDRTRRGNDPQGAPHVPVGTTLGTVAFLIIMAVLLWNHRGDRHSSWVSASSDSGHRGSRETQVVDRKGAKAARVLVDMPAGELIITGGAEHLLEADFSQGPSWETPSIDYSVEDGTGTLNINQPSSKSFMSNSDNIWKLKLDDEVAIDLKVDMGAGKGDLNLSKLDLTRLQLNIGAGQVNVDLTGERGKDLDASIHGGVGEAIVRLPKNIGVVANVHGGLGSIDVNGLKEEGGRYVNSVYGKAPNTIRLTVEGGIGHIRLDQE